MGRLIAWVRRFVRELRRRRVIRVAVVYAGTAFVILQLGEILVEPFGLPGWTLRLITLILILGFPLAVGLAWVFNVTEEGMVRTGADVEGEIGPEGKPLTSNGIIIGLLAVAIGLLLYPRLTGPAGQSPPEGRRGSSSAAKDTAMARLGPKSVAVLPFTYLAAEDSTDYFSLGMTDELTTRLSQVEDLSVIARTSVMQYRGTEKTIPEIARELGVAHVVEGSVQKVGGKLRIQAQLIDAREGEHLWAEGFTRPFQDVLGLQVDLAREIAGQLETKLLPAEEKQLADGRRIDSTAYALYLRGRELRFQETPESSGQAVRLLRRSVRADSTFAPAWATLSTAAWFGEAYGADLPKGVNGFSLAREAARKALALDSTSAEARVAMAVLLTLDGNYPAAGRHLRRAVELNPGLANAHREQALYFLRTGQTERALSAAKEAARLDPAAGQVEMTLSKVYFGRRKYKKSLRHIRAAENLLTEGHPDVLLIKAWNQFYLGRPKRALRLAGESKQILGSEDWDSFFFSPLRGFIFAKTGRPDSARKVLERLRGKERWPDSRALVHLGLGQKKAALSLLEQVARRPGGHYYPLWFSTAPWFDSVRDHPRFQKILERLGLDPKSGAAPG